MIQHAREQGAERDEAKGREGGCKAEKLVLLSK
jgi:hypothetical protein